MVCPEAVVLIAAMRVAFKMQTNERLSRGCKNVWKFKEDP